MTARIRNDLTHRGLQAISLENEVLRADIFPEVGAKIYNLVYKLASHNFLWHHPTIDLAAVPLGSSYDDHFSGGWDELFPNDAAGPFGGTILPDHGELWCRPWEWSVVKDTPEEVILYLKNQGAVTRSVFEKWLTLRDGESMLHFRHRLTNIGKEPLDFLWKLHPALAVTEHHRVDVPGRRGEYVSPGWSRLDNPEPVFDWPIARNAEGETADLRHILPATSGKRDFVYVTDLDDGWCAVTDTARRIGFGLVFPREVFTSVWLFMPAGGWRGLQTLVLEPCTAWPKDLEVAKVRGTISHLDPGGILECEVTCVAYSGMTGVGRIAPDGTVEPAPDGGW